jgi:UDP-glucose 4-epimerase
MRVLVTGGGGFIGTPVVNELKARGHEPIVLDHTTGGDILKPPFPPADHVIHLAGVLGTDELFDAEDEAWETNLFGTINVLRWCRHHSAGYTGITMPDVFPSIYTATKVAAGRAALYYRHQYGVRVSHVRAFNAFGPGQKHGHGHPRKIIPAFATEAWAGEPLKVWGDGTQTVDLVHVDDLARLLVDAMAFGDGEVFDGGTGKWMTVRQVARFVLDVVGGGEIEYLPMRRGERPTDIVATGEGWDLVGWKPQLRLGQLAAAVNWYRP